MSLGAAARGKRQYGLRVDEILEGDELSDELKAELRELLRDPSVTTRGICRALQAEGVSLSADACNRWRDRHGSA